MCLFFETLKIKDGEILNVHYHQIRVDKSSSISLSNHIRDHITTPCKGIYKLRITYDNNSVISDAITPYAPLKIVSLKIVEDNSIEYSKKYEDRTKIEQLRDQRSNQDDILIVKDRIVTDCSFANIIFYGDNGWVTPLNPLLEGTQRAYLLDQCIIKSQEIEMKHLTQFTKFMLINAMLEFDEERAVDYIYDPKADSIQSEREM